MSAHPKTEEWIGYASILRQNGFTPISLEKPWHWKLGSYRFIINFRRVNTVELLQINEESVFETIGEFEKHVKILGVLHS